ncbi:8466_t:CDS:2 [Cetraspora pellucida]|uniref:8466_t:CDS:1 n=1 Tax=Cetraspora pellucida TaxID=1433469 RepID=A0A9N8VHE7_9GLOM|nr:8466_t:CDS:2 [Cetraspora pellucida]
MATKTVTPKTQKPKVNNFVLVLEQFLEKYNLMAYFTSKQLSKHAPKLDALFLNWMTCRCVKVTFARGTGNRCLFSGEQVEALLPDKRKRKLTIKERTKYCAKIGDIMDIFTHHLDLGPKNDYENEIVTSGSQQSQFCVKLAEAGISPKIINTYAKDPKLIQDKRIQNIDVFKIPTREDLVDIIVMLSMRPAEVRSLQINHYEPDHSNIIAWYKDGYSWYCTGYLKSRGEKKKNPKLRPFLSMKKNPECARKLLTWIQDTIKVKKLSDSVFTGKGTYYRSKHASRIHGGKKPTPQYLKLFSRIAMRQESDHLDASDNYAIGDTESEKSDFEPKTSNSSKPQIQASLSSQTIEMNSILAEIDAMLAEIQK